MRPEILTKHKTELAFFKDAQIRYLAYLEECGDIRQSLARLKKGLKASDKSLPAPKWERLYKALMTGEITRDIAWSGPATHCAMRSGLLNAMRLGTSSPRIREKNVIRPTTPPNAIESAHGASGGKWESQAATWAATVEPPKAPARMPHNEIPTWTEDRKRVGSAASWSAARAPSLPSSASCLRRAFRAEMIAISAIAKTPFATSNRPITNSSVEISDMEKGTG